MTASIASGALAAFLLCGAIVNAAPDRSGCDALASTQAGWVCGVRQYTSSGTEYASFKGVPYAKQPLGELRFKELQPLEPWTDVLDATTEGPVCPQTDVVYKGIQTHKGGMNESCIHANIHVPLDVLPKPSASNQTDDSTSGVPIFVFVHGGGFAFGSGDTDLHGPEYLVSKGVIVITFNYRLNVFGFLSLNSGLVPGNNGLRDCVSLLRWVRSNARGFGGDPRRVTLAGQSAGAALAHLLTLAEPAQGLFERAVLFSGVGNSEFFSTSPAYAKIVADMFLDKVGIPPTLDPAETHRRLVATPADTLLSAHGELLELFGLAVFVPVVEQQHEGVTPVLPDSPDSLIASGRGRDIPLIVGFTSAECETFRPRFAELDIDERAAANPALLVPLKLAYQTPPAVVPRLVKLIEGKYFNGSRSLDEFVAYCSGAYYEYPALALARRRAALAHAPTFVSRFAFGGRRSALKEALHLDFEGAGHIEDITYVFRANSVLGALRGNELGERDEDGDMKARMTDYMVNFMRTGNPTLPGAEPSWPAVRRGRLELHDILTPDVQKHRGLDAHLRDTVAFFDNLHDLSQGAKPPTQ